MFYTYVLESLHRPGIRYIGHTANLPKRLEQHNTGQNRSTAKDKPWRVKLYVAFETLPLARDFERYLKTGSGHAFARRHFWS